MTAGTPPPGAVDPTPAIVDPLIQMTAETLDQFNKMYFAYQMSALIEVLILAFLLFVFKPYIPFLMSKLWNHLPVVGVMTRVRNIVPLGGFSLRNGLYRKELRDNVLYFDKKYLGSYYFMGVPFDFVHIDRGFVQEPIYNKYIATLSKMGYMNFTSIENALTFNGIDPSGEDTDRIVKEMGFDSYETAKSIVNPSNLTLTSEIYAPAFSTIPLDALLPYCSDWSPGAIAAQVSDTFEFRKPPMEPNLLLDILPYAILFLSIGIAGAMIITQVK